MGRLLLLGALIVAIWLIWQRLRRSSTTADSEAASYQETVRCLTCGVHLTVDRATQLASGDWLCPQHQAEAAGSKDHRD